MESSKQNVVLSFSPNSGSAAISQTDFSIDGEIKASIGEGADEGFRYSHPHRQRYRRSTLNAILSTLYSQPYTLDGRPVTAAYRGIVIIKGKKVVLK